MSRDTLDARKRRPFLGVITTAPYLRLADLFARFPIIILWTVLILPAAFLNHLFPIDQGGLFDRSASAVGKFRSIISPYLGQDLAQGLGQGRYFPFYRIYNALLFQIFSTNTTWYYLEQSVLFLVSALILTRIFTSVSSRGLATAFFAVAIFLSTPNVETLYTLYKAEPLVLFFSALVFLLFYFHSPQSYALSLSKCMAIALFFVLSIWSKETSVALFVFAAAGAMVAFLFSRIPILADYGRACLPRYLRLLVALGFGLALSQAPYWIFAPDSPRLNFTYTKFAITPGLVWRNLYFYFSQEPDVIGFGVLALVFLVIILRRAILNGKWHNQKAIFDFIFATSLLAMASSYGVIFSVWRFPMAYYLFVPAFLFRFVAAYGLYHVARGRLIGRRGLVISVIAAGGMLAYAVVYLWYAGASQVAYSRTYTNALRKYVSVSHAGDSLFFEPFPFYAEQVEGTNEMLQVAFRARRRLYGIGDLVNPALVTREIRELVSVSDAELAVNEKNWPRKNDYLIAITGSELGKWQVRGVSPFYSDGSDLLRDGGYDMDLVGEESIYFPAVFVNVWTHLPNVRRVYSGYQIYRIRTGPRFTWLGRYPDDWMGRRARLTLYPAYVSRALVHISTSRYNPRNNVTLLEDGVEIERGTLREGEERTIELRPRSGEKPTVFEFRVESTFFPEKLGLSDDLRELGALIRLEPFAPANEGNSPDTNR
jgi:hypothetical protein